jgi:hypothetical protein
LSDWKYAQKDASEKLAMLHEFSVHKRQADGDYLFRITVHEFVTPEIGSLRFFAQSDKQTNQDTAPFTPVGWGNTLLAALSECIANIHRFPYQGPETKAQSMAS